MRNALGNSHLSLPPCVPKMGDRQLYISGFINVANFDVYICIKSLAYAVLGTVHWLLVGYYRLCSLRLLVVKFWMRFSQRTQKNYKHYSLDPQYIFDTCDWTTLLSSGLEYNE